MSYPSIGIDLGTTHSCVAVFRDGEVEIIPNEFNEKTTPSWVYIDDQEIIVGKRAVMMATRKPKNTLYDMKRLIGRKFKEVDPEDLKNWQFQVVEQDSKPVVKIGHKTYHPEQICAMVLEKLKEMAEDYLDTEVKDVVIAVPAQFNNSQRQATIDAATIAGLNVLQLLVEPTAGALAYGWQHASEQERYVLVYDLGGGTFDVSIVKIKGEEFTIKATGGDTHLGGQDFDNRMVDYFTAEYTQDHHGVNLKEDRRAIMRLKMRCEDAKRLLSQHMTADIDIMNLINEEDYSTTVSRDLFEELIEPYVIATLKTVEQVLAEANMKKERIHDIVLVGGSSRIPRIQGALKHYFDNRTLKKSVNPDEAVAYGAAVRAATLNGDEILTKVKICDVTPLTLGVEIEGGFMSVMIPKNSPIPTTKIKEYVTSKTDQESMRATVYEGERPMVADNRQLGKITLENIPPGPRGSVKFDFTFDLDVNGLLKFTAIERSTNRGKTVDISYDTDRLSKDEIQAMIEEAERFRAEDQIRKMKQRAKTDLEVYCGEMMIKVKKGEIDGIEGMEVQEMCGDTLEWIDADNTRSKEDYERRLKILEQKFGEIEL